MLLNRHRRDVFATVPNDPELTGLPVEHLHLRTFDSALMWAYAERMGYVRACNHPATLHTNLVSTGFRSRSLHGKLQLKGHTVTPTCFVPE